MRRIFPMIVAITGLLAFLAACSQPTPGSALSVELDEGTLAVVRGTESRTVIAVSGGDGDVALAITGLPSGTTAQFSAESVDGSGGASELTILAEGEAGNGTYEATVTAIGDGESARAPLTITVQGLEVSGTVVGVFRQGIEGVSVESGGTVVVTDGDGNFSIPDLAVPYDLAVYTNDSGHLFQGLTTATPELLPVTSVPADLATATVEASLEAPVPPGYAAIACAEGISGPAMGCSTEFGGTDSTDILVSFLEGADVDLTIHVLLFEQGTDDLPVSSFLYGTEDVTVSPGGSEAVSVTLSGVAETTTLEGTIDSPFGFDPPMAAASVRVSESFVMPVLTDESATLPFSYVLPDFGFDQFQLYAYSQISEPGQFAAASSWLHSADPSTEVTIELLAPAMIASPPPESEVESGTAFTAPGTDGQPITLVFQIGDPPSPGDPAPLRLAVTGVGPSLSIPDLSDLDLNLAVPSGVSAMVTLVHAPATSTSVDEATYRWLADMVESEYAFTGGGPGLPSDSSARYSGMDFSIE